MKISVDIHLAPRPGMTPIIGHCSLGVRTRTCQPALATAAPARPPIRACEEDVGSPHHHVSRSQMMAPVRAARITYCVTCLGSTRPLAMVLATAVPNRNAAAQLNTAAHTTARRGESTALETPAT